MSSFTKNNFITFLFLFPLFSCGQQYFEGEITYDLEYIKKDSLFELNNIPSWPAKTAKSLCKNGSWIQLMDGGSFEYEYFNRQLNQQFYKARGLDTLLFLDYNQGSPEQEPVMSIDNLKGTDTILGKTCNKLILKTSNLTLTILYNDYLKINPDWYKNTKGGYYDIIYSNTKSHFLMAIIETDKYISIIRAKRVIFKQIPDEDFPDLTRIPKRKVE
jgi:hypothetical protein